MTKVKVSCTFPLCLRKKRTENTTVKQDWGNNSLWLEAKLGLGSIYNWRRKHNYTEMCT